MTAAVFRLFIFLNLCALFFPSKSGEKDHTANPKKVDSKKSLEEVIIGSKNAPHTIIIYTSFTCTKCREFHKEELPKFIKKYVDTGKVKIYLRNYLSDSGSFESSFLVKCLGRGSNEKIFKMYEKLFDNQKEWLKSKNPRQFLENIFRNYASDHAMGDNEIDRCLELSRKSILNPDNQDLQKAFATDLLENDPISAELMKEQEQALKEHGIILVPAFVIKDKGKDKVCQGKQSCEELAKTMKLTE